MSIDEYETLLRKQDGKCACCGTPDPGGVKGGEFAVDHDHKTNKVRALLCFHCNTALGHFKDDPGRLEQAAKYLRSFM